MLMPVPDHEADRQVAWHECRGCKGIWSIPKDAHEGPRRESREVRHRGVSATPKAS